MSNFLLNAVYYSYVKVYLTIYVVIATIYNNIFDRHREVKGTACSITSWTPSKHSIDFVESVVSALFA